MPEILTKILKLRKKIEAFPIYEYWKDIGNLDDYDIVSKKFKKK